MADQKKWPARKPTIGLTPDIGDVPNQSGIERYELKVGYAEAVLQSGGLPLVLPYSDDRETVDAYLDRISGLVVTGGGFDIPPSLYGEAPIEAMGPTKDVRTNFERALLLGALQRNLPVLGICGGMQLLAVLLGGTLYQDLPTQLSSAGSHQQDTDRRQPWHLVQIKPYTHLAQWLDRSDLMVNSTHHQAVKSLPATVVSTAKCHDGVIEAIESKVHAFALGVQWHPELLLDSVPANLGVYRGLISHARRYRRPDRQPARR